MSARSSAPHESNRHTKRFIKGPLGTRRFNIFIIHPSDWLTDHLAIGDGLVAHGFLWELASRGHQIHIAARMSELRTPFPPNVTLHHLPQTVAKRPLDRLEYMLRVRRLYYRLSKTVAFDVAHQMNPVFTGLSLCMAGCRVPIVLGTYVPDWPDDPNSVASRKGVSGIAALKIKSCITSLQQSLSSALLLTSPAARPRLKIGNRADSRIHYIEHGIDTRLFSPASDPPPALEAAPSILFLSNLGVKKGIFVLLEAFSQVIARVPSCRLTIAGGGNDFDAVRSIIEAQPWRDSVSLLGRIRREESVPLYRSHSLYTLPSFGEPYATTVIEAMSCGLAVVTTNIGGVPYLVMPGGGLTVPPRDPDALAAALVQLLLDGASASAMGTRNRERVLTQNTWKGVVDKLEGVYGTVSAMRE